MTPAEAGALSPIQRNGAVPQFYTLTKDICSVLTRQPSHHQVDTTASMGSRHFGQLGATPSLRSSIQARLEGFQQSAPELSTTQYG